MVKKTGSHRRKHIKCQVKGCDNQAGTIPGMVNGKLVQVCPTHLKTPPSK
ncbi:hypothetical protein [Mangrovactinospora gilvigrisea]|nr:hypothetical protein [Mangrovactinospora gilvigrisea]